MPTYIALLRFTQKGIETIKEGPSRLDRARQAFKAAGAQLKAFSLATGRHDAIAIIDAPNDEAVARIALGAASQGDVRSETVRAFTEEEYRKIIAALP